MYAIVRDSQFDPAKLAKAHAQLQQFQSLHAGQPGYAGTVLVDASNGRMLIVTMWENEELAMRGREVLGPQVQRLLGPLMTRESHVVGDGQVLLTDMARRHEPVLAL
jgi:hypothetical protein